MTYAQHFAEFTGTAVVSTMVVTSDAPTTLSVVLQGTNTSWVNGTTTFSVSGLAGASVTATAINNGTQVATLTVTCTNDPTGVTLTFTDSLDSAIASATPLSTGGGAVPRIGSPFIGWDRSN